MLTVHILKQNCVIAKKLMQMHWAILNIIEKHGNVTVKVKSRSQNKSHIKGFIKIHGEFMN